LNRKLQKNREGRGHWGSRFAFVLAAAGSAIGLGNIWRFPVSASEGGGGAFLLIYLLCVALVALPVMLAEMVVGRAGEKNPVGALQHLRPGSRWYFIGVMGVATGVIILSYYSVIAGWTLYYFFQSALGTFTPGADTEAIFLGMAGNAGLELGFHALFMGITVVVVAGGIRGGIERTIKILMPLFFVLLIVLVVRAVTLPGANVGLAYYLTPDFSQVTGRVWLSALGQAFFSLSLGMGVMITYGSYLAKKENLPASAGFVAGADTIIAVLAGFIIFPAIFFAGLEPGTGGPALVFIALPQIFSQMPGGALGGIIFGSTFFLLLAVAALTSAISLLEVVVAHMVDDWGWARKKAAWLVGAGIYLVGVPSALSLGAVAGLSELPFLGIGFLDLMDKIAEFTLILGGLGLAVFVGWIWGLKHALAEIRRGTPEFKMAALWSPLLRYVAPLAIGIILATQIYNLLGQPSPEPAEEEATAAAPPIAD
jgi:neurotransmitter:Na+ symporter, NSS family